MSEAKHPSTIQLAAQIEVYRKELPHYETYAKALKRVLKKACKLSVPYAIVQARAKDVSSFAEKCVRKFEKYPHGAREMTDLCGGRVIVQTLQQVKAVRLFIEQNFTVLECDDKGLLLGEGAFGYRDMHYLVRLRADRAALLGFSPEEIKAIGQRIAEVQVRTWVQHAWADTLHDRIYKAPLKLSGEAKRTGALLAAIMEDGDRAFDRLATEIDGTVANYAAYHRRPLVEEEIATQKLLLASEKDAAKKPRVALQLARLLGPCGDYAQSARVLKPFATTGEAVRCEILLELGYALCQTHRQHPISKDYQLGQECLEQVVEQCACGDFPVVPNLRKRKSIHARALARLAWTWEVVPEGEGQARQRYREALEMEPANPYLLASQLGFEIFCLHSDAMIDSMRSTIQQAIETCCQHASAGTELPYAWFMGGRLSLLLGNSDEAIGWYARGLRYLFDPDSCVPLQVLEDEIKWIQRIHHGAKQLPKEDEWIERLISLARKTYNAGEKAEDGQPAIHVGRRALILAGGAAHMSARTLRSVRPLVQAAMEAFEGTVMPGLAGEVAKRLKRQGRKRFELVGYRPESPPKDAPIDHRYDRHVEFKRESDFSAEQILKTWEDLIAGGVTPSQVSLLGLGGGRLTAVEYYVALALGATVGVVQLPKPAAVPGTITATTTDAESILDDSLWKETPSLLPLPYDVPSVRAFVGSAAQQFKPATLDKMAMAFHTRYVAQTAGKLPPNMRPWPDLDATYRKANLEQARYAAGILRAARFAVRMVRGKPNTSIKFTAAQVETMAALEHGRWNVERLRDGWRPGKPRDDGKKIHDCLIPWQALPEHIKDYDRAAVRAFPEILAKAALEVYRPKKDARGVRQHIGL
jgi:ppGpp synthetase/RelA/SpoT-type nucleotidyltranferase